MESSNSSPNETAPVPAPEAAPAPVASAPEAAPAPVASAPEAAPVVKAAPAPVEIFRGIIPQTKGTTPGSWNRFAGYNKNDAKNKKNDGRGRDGKGRR